jgi:hypothetical protein
MLGRRRFLGLMVIFVCLSGANTTPVQAKDGLRGGNMAAFVKRQAEKQKAKKEKIEKKEEEKSGD